MWCWRRLLRVPWAARRSNQYILKETSPGCSLEGVMLKLKHQYFGYLMQRVDSLEKTLCWEGLGAGGRGDNRGWDGWMASPTQWMSLNELQELVIDRPGMLRFMGSQRVGHNWATELNRALIFIAVWYSVASSRCSLAQLCLTLCNPMDCSTPGSSVLCLLEFA